MTKGCTIWPQYWMAIKDLPEDMQKEICLALVRYCATQDMEGISPIANAMIQSWKIGLDNSIENHMKGNERKTGRPKKSDYSGLTDMRRSGMSAQECAAHYNVSIDTIYNRIEWKNGGKKKESEPAIDYSQPDFQF